MLKSKHIDRLCLAVIGVAVLVTLAFMNGERFGLAPASAEPGYATRLFDASRVHTIDIEIDDYMLLRGLSLIWQRNRRERRREAK